MPDPPAPDPYADEWKKAVKNGGYQDRKGLIVAGAAVLSGVAVLAFWFYAFKDDTYVYASTGGDASFAMLRRGVLLAVGVALAVAFVLAKALGLRESAYTKGLGAFFRR